jgi:hypothetical protein
MRPPDERGSLQRYASSTRTAHDEQDGGEDIRQATTRRLAASHRRILMAGGLAGPAWRIASRLIIGCVRIGQT